MKMPKRILVADDDKTMLGLYKRIFLKSGHMVAQASSYTEALDLINSEDFDLLITDLMFPDGQGTKLIKIFEKKRAGAKSLLVTGSASEVDAKLLPSEYLQKPFTYEVFMGAVAKALS